MTPPPVDGQWLDFYALLDVPVSADEDTIRKRIGKVYSEAAANSDHRDLSRRHYFQSLVERVLPQCRRVLLDPEWRAKYDRQHILHSIGDPSAQDYVAFIASMRGKDAVIMTDEENLPQRLQDDIKAAREVVECARQGTELDLLPSKAVSRKEETFSKSENIGKAHHSIAAEQPSVKPRLQTPRPSPAPAPPETAPAVSAPLVPQTPVAPPVAASNAPQGSTTPLPTPQIEEIQQDGAPVHATVITAQEAAAIRRRRASNPDGSAYGTNTIVGLGDGALVGGRRRKSNGRVSRVSVGDSSTTSGRLISPTSMNLMVAITGVLLTITIQKFAVTPAVATNVGRTPIYLAVASEMEDAMQNAESDWEKTPEGANYDLIVQPVDSRSGLRRALGAGGQMPDAWIPSDSLWSDRYNSLAAGYKRDTIVSDQSIAQTPIVLVARADRSGELKKRFPDHLIPSWSALRDAINVKNTGAQGHLGLTDPQKAATGALARVSMAREWGASRGLSANDSAKNGAFWKWMAGFEDNAPAAPSQTGAMVKDLVQGTSGRFWWGIAYESDALQWMKQGKSLEIYYLPRTTIADHPFCHIDRVGAPSGVAQGRASFEKFLRTSNTQKKLLDEGFRPIEVNLKTRTTNNPFLNVNFRQLGARADNLPRAERISDVAVETIATEWGKRYG